MDLNSLIFPFAFSTITTELTHFVSPVVGSIIPCFSILSSSALSLFFIEIGIFWEGILLEIFFCLLWYDVCMAVYQIYQNSCYILLADVLNQNLYCIFFFILFSFSEVAETSTGVESLFAMINMAKTLEFLCVMLAKHLSITCMSVLLYTVNFVFVLFSFGSGFSL